MHPNPKWLAVIPVSAAVVFGWHLLSSRVEPRRESASASDARSAVAVDSMPGPEHFPDGRLKRETVPGNGKSAEISRLLASGKEGEKIRALEEVLPGWIRDEPLAAARAVEDLESWAWREQALHVVARSWALDDPGKAAGWASMLKDEAERNTALADIAIVVAAEDPGRAVELVMKHGMDDPANALFLHLAHRWAERDFSAAVGWISAQPGGEFRDQAFARVAASAAARDPSAAAELAAGRIGPGNIRDEALLAILHQWLPRDSAEAESWIGRVPEGEFRRRAEEELASFRSYQVQGAR